MIKSNQNPKLLLTFPENSAQIITEILKKYGLEESSEEFFEGWRTGKKDRGEILVDLLIKMSEANLSVSELADLAKKELNITAQKAQKIIEDLNREILVPAIQISEKILSEERSSSQEKPKEIAETEIPERLKPKRKDIYREPIK